ncbi:acyltransferase family protein [Amycolatopsis solani]|uniref:acyltransferase family protein n=1 Tax=Amycolatopsis solani TaxID=3028615 RepID=UPI0025B1B0FA|nr:acyltransferase [Amycolatopsis sp. MEP2-6]
MTGLRFYAAFVVFLFHTGIMMNPALPTGPINPFADVDVAKWYGAIFGTGGFVGVSFFFVLSGFVLSWSVKPGERARAFIRRRLVKVFPNHLAMWVAAMVLFAAAYTSWKAWLPNLFLIHPWFPDFSIAMSVDTPSWSLGGELLFYVLFPLIIRPILKMDVRRLWLWAGIMVAGLFAYQLVATFVVPSDGANPNIPISPLQYWFGYFLPVGRLFEFVLGAVLARIVLAGKWIGIKPAVSVVFMVVGYVASMFVPFQFSLNFATLIPIAVMVASFANADLHGTRTRLRGRVAVWLGNVSFGFYLSQGVTIFYLRSLMGNAVLSTPLAILVLIGLFVVTLFVGWLLYRFVETPMMRRFSRARPPRIPAPRAS